MSSSSSSSSTTQTPSPHLLVFPYPAQGHILPLLHFLHHLTLRSSLTITVILTPKNAHLLSPAAATIHPLILPLPSHPSLPPGAENVKDLPSAAYNAALAHALAPLRTPILQWARTQTHLPPPTALLSDFFLGWTHSLASDLHVPFLVFYSSGAFLASVLHHLWPSYSHSHTQAKATHFASVPGSPSFPESHLPSLPRRYRPGVPEWECMRQGMLSNSTENWGFVVNTFTDLEGVYLEHLKEEFGHRRVWAVGPILPVGVVEQRGGAAAVEILEWLDSCPEENSVVYVSFGSQFSMPPVMAEAMAAGLEASGVRFIWCVKEKLSGGRSVVPEGFEERTEGRGVVVRGWAPQVAVLRHRAVGAFLTHCGWNSALEGLVAGVPLLIWPVEADQFVNARLVAEEVGVGVKVGEGAEAVPDPAEIGRVMAELVGGGGGFRMVRERAAEMRRKARAAVEKGGSSDSDLEELLKELHSNII